MSEQTERTASAARGDTPPAFTSTRVVVQFPELALAFSRIADSIAIVASAIVEKLDKSID